MQPEAQIPKTIDITIKTIDGGEDRFKFEQTILIREAKTEIMCRFCINPPPGEKYKLAEKKDGKFRPLEDNNSLVNEGVENKDTLWLSTEQQVGGTE